MIVRLRGMGTPLWLGALLVVLDLATAEENRQLVTVSPPHCERAARPPVRGELHQRKLYSHRDLKDGGASSQQVPEEAWEFALEAGCTYALWEKSNVETCLSGAWVVLLGASQTNIWTTVLANMLALGMPLLTKRDNFSIDGVFTQLLDVVIEDGKVIYKNIVVDKRREDGRRIGTHSRERDSEELRRVFAQESRAPSWSPKRIRITNFFAEYWDNVDLGLEAVQAASSWAHAKLTLAVAVGLWYINSLHCGAHTHWCGTRPELGTLSLEDLVDTYKSDMEETLNKLEPFCMKGGRAGELGCSVASIDHCQFMQGDIWHMIFDAAKGAMAKRVSPLFRFVDLWTFTLEIPEDCLGGHQSPMSTMWTWQLFLSGICDTQQASKGTLAAFEGPTCRSSQVNKMCPNMGRPQGFHYAWECALARPCTLRAVTPPASLMPVQTTAGTVHLDLAATANAPLPVTWSRAYHNIAAGFHWILALGLVAVASSFLIVMNRLGAAEELGRAKQPTASVVPGYEKIDTSSPKAQVVVTFQPGPIGLDATESTGQITCVRDGQAKAAGVQEGWIFSSVDGEPYSAQLLDAKRTSGLPYRVDFVTAHQAIRVDLEQSKPESKAALPADKFSFGLARCIASMHVVAGHLYARQAIIPLYLFSWGFTWVPWFFMLSGFILYSAEAAKPRGEPPHLYVARRSVSIYPLYAVSLIASFIIAKTQAAAPPAYVLLLQAWLLQAWVPQVTERTLQMQCWFLSCLVLYWAAFRPLFRAVSATSLRSVVALIMLCFALPWLIVLVPAAIGEDLQWYNEHTFGHSETALDLGVIFLKFHPLCYMHVFVLGMLLGQLRRLLQPYAGAHLLKMLIEILAPAGYLFLGLIFTVPALRPLASKLSSRLSVLLPLQSAILVGLAGLPGSLPLVARWAGHLNFLEGYSYAVYVMQFICYHLWPETQVDISFFFFLAACAALMVHLVQRPSDKLWRFLDTKVCSTGRFKGTIFLVFPAAVSLVLLGFSLFPDPDLHPELPRMLRLGNRLVDIRLPLFPEGGSAMINPALLFRGDEVVIVARRHRRESEQLQDTYEGKTVAVLEETWHSEIVMGRMVLNRDAWDQWLTTGKAPVVPALQPWSGLSTATHLRWAHLCVREKWIPENQTLVRLVVTGPEDAKVFVQPRGLGQISNDEEVAVAFSSYPPLGRRGCGKKRAVSQMYLASNVEPSRPSKPVVGIRLQCGSDERAEKNWIPFERRGKLYFVYSVLPHVVMEAQQNGECGHRHYSNFAPLVRLQGERPGLAFRGSAQAIFIDDPEATPNLPKAHFLSFLHIVDPKTHRYAHFAYRFAPDPPFDIMQVSEQLPLRALQAEDGGAGFAFVSGVAMRDRQVVVSYAAGDSDPRALVLTLWRLDEMFRQEDAAAPSELEKTTI